MSFIQLCALLFVGLFFGGCMKGIVIPFLKKRFDGIPPFLLVLASAFLASVGLFCGSLFLYVLQGQIIPLGLQLVFLLSFIGISLSLVFLTKPRLYWFCVWFLCFLGTLLLPGDVSFLLDPLTGIFYCLLASVLWLCFIAVMTLLDRIPLFSFLGFISLYLGGAFVSADFLRTLPVVFYNPFIFALVLFVCITYILKQNNLFSFGKPLVFFFSYLIGFAGVYLAAMGKGIYLPVFIGYELLEVALALGLNLYTYHQLYPIQVPFLAERALMHNKLVGKVLQKIFMFCFVLSSLAALCVYGTGNYVLLAYVFLGIILYNAYLNLSTWGEKKVRFRDIFKDLKEGVNILKKEMMRVPLKAETDKTVQKTSSKKLTSKTTQKIVKKTKTQKNKKNKS